MKISVITTVKDGADELPTLVDSLLHQTKKPDEIVVCDSFSSDDTWKILTDYEKKYPFIKPLRKKGGISAGRNKAIAKAKYDVIAVTDVGCRPVRAWLERITDPFEDSKVMAVSGFFKTDSKSMFEKISSTLMLSDHDNINSETWLPSSRSIAFRKEVWEKVGGYPESFSYAGEDTVFDISIKEAGYKFIFVPEAVVYWRPRVDIEGFFKQYYQYSVGDGLHLTSFVGYVKKILIYLVGAAVLISVFWYKAAFLIFVVGVTLYFLKRDLRVIKKIPYPITFFLAPLLTATADLAVIIGYIRGVLSRGKK